MVLMRRHLIGRHRSIRVALARLGVVSLFSLGCFMPCRYDRTPLDEALSGSKQSVVDAIHAATAAASLGTTNIS